MEGPTLWVPDEGPRESSSRHVALANGSLFVMSPFSLRRSRDRGASFEVLDAPVASSGDAPITGFDGALFVGTERGVWKSADDGATWSSANTGLENPIGNFYASASSLLATETDGSLHRWSPAEGTWSSIPLEVEASVNVAASDGETTLVDTGHAVLRSSAASAWTVAEGLDAWGYRDLAIDRNIGVAITSIGELRHSSDAGLTWQPVHDLSIDVGSAFRAVRSNDAFVAVTDGGIARSTDGGARWEMAHRRTEVVGYAEMAEEKGLVFVDAEGLSVSADAGATWSDTSAFADSTPVRFGRVGPWLLTSTASRLVHSSRGDGEWEITDTNGYSLRDVDSNDRGTYVVFSARAHGEAGFGPSWVSGTTDDGTTFHAVPTPEGESFFGQEFDSLVATGDFVLLGSKASTVVRPSIGVGVWRSDDDGDRWTRASEGLPTVPQDGLGLPLYPGVLSMTKRQDALVALLDGEGVFQSIDEGELWTRVGASLDGTFAEEMDQLHAFGDDLFLTSREPGAPLLHYSGASSDGAWEVLPLKGLPPEAAVTSLVSSRRSLVAAVQTPPGEPGSGVYVSRDGGVRWRRFGLDRRVRALFLDGDVLLAGVEGEGVYSVDFGRCL